MADQKSPKSSKHSLKQTSAKRSAMIRRFTSPNPFVNYLTEYLRSPENKDKEQKLRFKLAANRWKEMNDSDKTQYIDAAEYNQKRRAIERAKNPPIRKRKISKKCSACGHKHGKPIPKQIKRKVQQKPEIKQEEKDDEDSISHNSTESCQTNIFESDTMATSISSF